MIYGDNCSQQYREIKYNFSLPFYYPLFINSHKGIKEVGTRYKTNVTVLFIQNLNILIVNLCFPT